jgi:hypothetical protein
MLKTRGANLLHTLRHLYSFFTAFPPLFLTRSFLLWSGPSSIRLRAIFQVFA